MNRRLTAFLLGIILAPAAAMVIDDPTWERAGACVGGFETREGSRIRGRSDALTIHHLPLEA